MLRRKTLEDIVLNISDVVLDILEEAKRKVAKSISSSPQILWWR